MDHPAPHVSPKSSLLPVVAGEAALSQGLGGCARIWLVHDLSFLDVYVKSQKSISSGKSIQDVLEVNL